MYLMDYYTIPMSLAGLPALSVPCGWTVPEGGSVPMPIGLQLAAPLFAERLLLGAAHAYETAHAARRAHASRCSRRRARERRATKRSSASNATSS